MKVTLEERKKNESKPIRSNKGGKSREKEDIKITK